MKKKIFCIIAVAMILAMTLTFTISAYEHDSFDYYNEYTWRWADVEVTEGEDPYCIGVKQPLLPLLYNTFVDSNDNAERVYMLDLAKQFEPQYLQFAMYNTHYASKTLESGNVYYKPNAINFAYKPLFYNRDGSDDANTIRPWEPKNNHPYDSVMICFYVTNADGTEPMNGSVAMVTSSVTTETGATVLKALEFNSVGEYKVTTRVVFFNYVDNTTCEVESTIPVTVVTLTEDEQDQYQRGYAAGYQYGHDIGYRDGYHKGREDSSEWNLLGLINAIAKAPFTFIDSAFNFTIFGINVANGIHTIFTLGIIGLVVYAVIKLII